MIFNKIWISVIIQWFLMTLPIIFLLFFKHEIAQDFKADSAVSIVSQKKDIFAQHDSVFILSIIFACFACYMKPLNVYFSEHDWRFFTHANTRPECVSVPIRSCVRTIAEGKFVKSILLSTLTSILILFLRPSES